MALEITKNKVAPEIEQKSKGLNGFLWLLVVAIVIVAAVSNIYLVEKFSTALRVVGIVVALLIALGIAAITNQGMKAVKIFFRFSY